MTASFRSSKARAFCSLAACCFLFLPLPTRAQLGRTAGPGSSLDDLKAARPAVPTDERKRGPLIAITPEKVRWDSMRVARRADGTEDDQPEDPAALQPLNVPDEKDALDAEVVARHFRRKLIRLSTLSIFAPPKMTLLNTHLQPANPFQGAQLWDAMKRLEATLTPAQWQMLGSPVGLGMGDVTKDQQPFFDAILPENMTVNRQMSQNIGGIQQSVTIPSAGGMLTPEQRQGVRLHLERKVQMNMVDEKNQSLPMMSPFHSDKMNAPRIGLAYNGDSNREGMLFGQSISQEVPNRLKPSDLDLKQALLQETWVPLTGVKTVGDLLKAAQKATGLELHADDRLARLSVYVSTEDRLVHASDLLEALCWSLTATYRKVGPVPGGDPKDFAYVLTYDRTGIAALHGAIVDWSRRGEALRNESSTQFDAAINKMKPAQYIGYAEGDTLTPSKDALMALHTAQEDASDTGTYNGSQNVIPISALTAEQRQQMQEGLKQIDQTNQNNANNGNNGHPMAARTDRVSLWDSVTVTYVIPGVGEIPSNSSWSDGTFTPEFPPDDAERIAVRAANRLKRHAPIIPAKSAPPIALGQIIVSIAPASSEEVEPIFAAASSLGVGEVWIATPGIDSADAGRKLLAACAASGAAHGVKVGAQVSLVRVPSADAGSQTAAPGSALEDRNAFGETGAQWAAHFTHATEGIDLHRIYVPGKYDDGRDLLAAEAPAARTLLAERLQMLAAVPGLSTLALRDAAAPGRNWSPATQNYQSWIGSDFGYTVADRLTFLRQSGYDPIDLTERFSDYQVTNVIKLPRFEIDSDQSSERYYYSAEVDTTKASKDWSDCRAQTERDLLHGIRADLKKTRPDMAVYLAAYDTGNIVWTIGQYQRWSDANAIPFGSVGAAPKVAMPLTSAGTAPAPSSKTDDKTDERLLYFPLGIAYAPLVQKGFPSPTASPTELNLFDYAAMYVRRSLPDAARQPAASAPVRPPDIILDMSGMKTADALTLLRGMLQALTGKK